MSIDVSEASALYLSGLNLREVGERVGCTHGYLSRVLRGILRPPGRRWPPGYVAARPSVDLHPCAWCGGMTRLRTNLKYCSADCYMAAIANPLYVQHRGGTRHARKAVEAAGVVLLPGYVVHHVDSDNHNNTLGNLWVFRCSGDHMAFHRLGMVTKDRWPIWCGIIQLQAA